MARSFFHSAELSQVALARDLTGGALAVLARRFAQAAPLLAGGTL